MFVSCLSCLFVIPFQFRLYIWWHFHQDPRAVDNIIKRASYKVRYIRNIVDRRKIRSDSGVKKYSYHVRWVQEDPEYEWLCLDLEKAWKFCNEYLPDHENYREQCYRIEYHDSVV